MALERAPLDPTIHVDIEDMASRQFRFANLRHAFRGENLVMTMMDRDHSIFSAVVSITQVESRGELVDVNQLEITLNDPNDWTSPTNLERGVQRQTYLLNSLGKITVPKV